MAEKKNVSSSKSQSSSSASPRKCLRAGNSSFITMDGSSPRRPLLPVTNVQNNNNQGISSPAKKCQRSNGSQDSGIALSPAGKTDRSKLYARRPSLSSQSSCSTSSEFSSIEFAAEYDTDYSKKFQGDENVSPAISSLFSGPLKLCSNSDSTTPGKGRRDLRRESSVDPSESAHKSPGDSFKRPQSGDDCTPLKNKRVKSCLSEYSFACHAKASKKQQFLTGGISDEYSSSDEGMDLDGSFSECVTAKATSSTSIVTKQRRRTSLVKCHSESAVTIMKEAVEKFGSDASLVGDASKSHALEFITNGKHSDLKEISGETLVRLMNGEFDDKVNSYQVIDCRYPYEYENGHIRGAINMYTQKQIHEHFIQSKSPKSSDDPICTKNDILIFHCEFSSQRGPDMCRFLRDADRNMNLASYPALHYPELYVLHGGYKAFFEQFQSHCEPQVYTPMLDPNFEKDYRFYKNKSKSDVINPKISKSKSTSQKLQRSKSLKKFTLDPSLSSPMNAMTLS